MTYKDFKRVSIGLKCACGRELQAMKASGAVTVTCDRKCECGLHMRIVLEFVEYQKDVPVYRFGSVEFFR